MLRPWKKSLFPADLTDGKRPAHKKEQEITGLFPSVTQDPPEAYVLPLGLEDSKHESIIGLEMKEKTHASSPSTSGKTHEKTSVIQTRRLQFDV